MTKLDWEKAKRGYTTPPYRGGGRTQHPKLENARVKITVRGRNRQQTLARFAELHGLVCSKCKRSEREWAKSGIESWGPWIICAECIKPRKP